MIRAQRIGYRFAAQEVDVRENATSSLTLRLTADPFALEAVVVSGNFNAASKLESSTAITTFSASARLANGGRRSAAASSPTRA